MYNVNMYKDARGKCQVCQLIKLLEEGNSKQDKGALKQIYYQIQRIEKKGTRAGEGITKQLRGDIWEIRPGKYRITYVVNGNDIILLTWFRKETKKTPIHEIEKAERTYKDWQKNHG
ncbi:type II toxin-antitoxin system RelE/ParE family toxin [Bacillus thuringiensis]|uniref:type II toxin-antitoxin system RelE/ParE family toxin n=1 Tax=Bacillus thuringiensis TaxID=1428 RepID=UPI001298B234|nr:type II toxin-antitoxin system RelE/ParE family toxin [Bacillus thuringiensis]MEB8931946.1 type II toxin-antitoxin system RelE/ParE family toxin [Bacillus cereus]MCR6790313.1 type II toxin-antitoxin system RelE/ParE family toxin [Bacillus thuringiensis]MCR6826268.1 type II toxin-antitoxin system RelE/ParE family toxin [Bacillus thuringiensis]MCR6832166.1 type II toxin-antitoxin system RelE/ParE family toxin [Bacillus thuringiensis]MEB9325903.1 type II toxin-antitoxin system RelE/ParE family